MLKVCIKKYSDFDQYTFFNPDRPNFWWDDPDTVNVDFKNCSRGCVISYRNLFIYAPENHPFREKWIKHFDEVLKHNLRK